MNGGGVWHDQVSWWHFVRAGRPVKIADSARRRIGRRPRSPKRPDPAHTDEDEKRRQDQSILPPVMLSPMS